MTVAGGGGEGGEWQGAGVPDGDSQGPDWVGRG